jgi:hypothetical protein
MMLLMTLAHHLYLGGPLARKGQAERPGFTFFRAGAEISLIAMSARVNLGLAPAEGRGQGQGRVGVAPVKGQKK